MSAHAKLPPSSAHRWLRCPGSIALCATLPAGPDSVHSREGTFAHECAALLLLGQEPIGRTNGEFTCDATMRAHLQSYADIVHLLRLADDIALGDMWVEQRVDLSTAVWGTADCVLFARHARRLHVVDLKYGAGVLVPALGNEQLMVYGAAALASIPQIQLDEVDDVELHIVQPRRADGEGRTHRSHLVSRRQLQAFAVRVLLTAAAIQDGDVPELKPGDYCTFCPARLSCPQLRQLATTTMQQVLTPETTPAAAEMLTNAQCAEVLDRAELLELWIRSVRQDVERRLLAGEKVPGRKLVERIGNRKWTDEAAAINALVAKGVDPYEQKLVSPAEAERRLRAGAAGKRYIEPLTTRPVTGLMVVPEGDSRPAASPRSLGVFSDLDSEAAPDS